MNTALKDISTNLNDLKLITSTQVDLSYFNSLVSSVFSDQSIYANIQSSMYIHHHHMKCQHMIMMIENS